MIKTLFLNFKINSYYTINSYIYNLRKLPVMKDLLEEDAYKYNSVKVIGFVFGLILSIFVFLTMKLTYFGVIYLISKCIPGNTLTYGGKEYDLKVCYNGRLFRRFSVFGEDQKQNIENRTDCVDECHRHCIHDIKNRKISNMNYETHDKKYCV